MDLALDFFGPERVLFGTDTPFDATGGQYFTQETLRSLGDMRMTPRTRNAIMSGNAKRLLKLG
jgi:predicted TIM-barrel fold metal-dependent hydrolase